MSGLYRVELQGYHRKVRVIATWNFVSADGVWEVDLDVEGLGDQFLRIEGDGHTPRWVKTKELVDQYFFPKHYKPRKRL